MASVVESPTRTVDGVEFPAAGTWALDPTHTRVDFEARHLMVAKVKGHFGGPEGELVIGEDPAQSEARVTIATATIDTGVEQRDQHLKSPDFLEVEAYPEIAFTSTLVRARRGRGLAAPRRPDDPRGHSTGDAQDRVQRRGR